VELTEEWTEEEKMAVKKDAPSKKEKETPVTKPEDKKDAAGDKPD
jgi:hypothetical protein